ncbi:MAG: PQQ-dependent sugar dehydrogenase [Bythopirellula sp.]
MLATRNLILCAITVLTLAPAGFAQTVGSASIAHWSFVLEDVVQVPNSSGQAPRLEYLIGGPDNGLAYVIDQRGPIYSFNPTSTSPTTNLFLDARVSVGSLTTGNESGVRGLAFHPDFNNSGAAGFRKMYTTLSRNSSSSPVGNPVIFDSPGSTNHYTVVGEWDVAANGTVNTSSYRELMRVEQPFGNHNSGHIGFNPTASSGDDDYGKLYIAVGDGGSSGGPFDLSQDIDATPAPYPHGKILRIDPLVGTSSPYTIPSDNPFSGIANRVQESWAYGLRNPHKFGWDSVTGEMYISDIGQGNIEEISVGHANANYGWNDREGTFVYPGLGALPPNHATDDFTYPVAQYDHSGTNGISGSSAIVGGTVYRGDQVPELTGMYLFADFATNPGPIFAVDVDDLVERDAFPNVTSLNGGRLSPFVEVEIRESGSDKDLRQFLRDVNNNGGISRTDLRWGLGPDGEIYVLHKRDGMVRRIAAVVDLDPGDANRDGEVNQVDLGIWRTNYALAGDWSDGNFNAGPVTDGDDFVLWQRNSGGSVPVAAVPEPTTLLLACAAAMAALRRARSCRRPHL